MANLTAELTLLSQNQLFAVYAMQNGLFSGQLQIPREKLDPTPPKVLQLAVMSLVPSSMTADRR